MASKALAIKYRPKTFDDVTEQGYIKRILENQINTNTIKHGYLFVGGAGTGKTTTARIFANYINHGAGNPIELDAASNNSVDDIRRLVEQAQTKPLDSEYKVFILDEVHVLSNQAWQALLKTLEEPPSKAIFILCTTNPEKIPNTILSRVQRYNFQRISLDGIFNRLINIIEKENYEGANITYTDAAIELIAKTADGGMRDAITMLDKCLSYTHHLNVDVCIDTLGVADYFMMMELTDYFVTRDLPNIMDVIERVHNAGKDLKLFMRQYMEFVLDLNKYFIGCDWKYINIPSTEENIKWLKALFGKGEPDDIKYLLDLTIKVNAEIKYMQNPKYYVEASFMGGL